MKQTDKQVLASDIRVKIAEKEIEIHNKNVEQTNELDEFYRDKFTNLGLYNYLSTSMFRLYKKAYNLAYEMALNAEQAYRFEQGDETKSFIAHDNWQFDRAGLLAGESLILQLERMEKAYLDNNKRQNEITQSFSLALLDPLALTDLKEKGNCEFTIPEFLFNLIYPGQYNRIIKSVRITVPCLTGPFINTGAKLTLRESWVRSASDADDPTDPNDLKLGTNIIPVISISTSSAQNDSGTFEFSFRDERYLPFEGSGAISHWMLELPSKILSFDYQTISDVIISISYTAKEGDSTYRKAVEDKIESDLKEVALVQGLFRLVSLKHDFPDAFYKLLNPRQGNNQKTEFVVGKNFFPYFLINEKLILSSGDNATIYLRPKGKEPVNTDSLTFNLNSIPVSIGSWTIVPDTIIKGSLKQSTLALSGQPDSTWTIDAGTDGFDREKLDDIVIIMKYKIEE